MTGRPMQGRQSVRKLLVSLATLMAVAVAAAPTQAREPDWVLLGEQTVGFVTDRDVINIGQSEDWYRDRRFRALHFRAERNDVHMVSIRLVYMNGHAETIDVDRLIRSGEEIPIDLRGERSYLRQIEMTYRSRPSFKGQAVVSVYGEPARRGMPPIAPVPPAASGPGSDWVVLGEQTVGFEAERDVIRVGQQEGRFSRIRLEVRGNDVYVNDIRVRFRDGTQDTFQIRQEIRAGSRSQPLDLTGDRRVIETIELAYRARPGFRGKAVVAVLGDHAPDRGRDAPPPPRSEGGYGPDILRHFNNFGRKDVEPGDDRVTIGVSGEREPQKTIILLAHERPVFVRDVEIVFRNGERQNVRIDELIEPGRGTGPIDLAGTARNITRVIVSVRPTGGRGRAELQLMASQRDISALGLEHRRRR